MVGGGESLAPGRSNQTFGMGTSTSTVSIGITAVVGDGIPSNAFEDASMKSKFNSRIIV